MYQVTDSYSAWSSLDIVGEYDMVEYLKYAVSAARNEDTNIVYEKALRWHRKLDLNAYKCLEDMGDTHSGQHIPVFRKGYFLSFCESCIRQLDMRFSTMCLCLIPSNVETLNEESIQSRVDRYSDDMLQPSTFHKLWKCKWNEPTEKADNITDTISDTCKRMFRTFSQYCSFGH